jgi:hypothetical protein
VRKPFVGLSTAPFPGQIILEASDVMRNQAQHSQKRQDEYSAFYDDRFGVGIVTTLTGGRLQGGFYFPLLISVCCGSDVLLRQHHFKHPVLLVPSRRQHHPLR